MIKTIISAEKDKLNAIDLSNYEKMTKSIGCPKNWFYLDAGKEHYRLLTYISTLFTGQTLLDIGTFKGSSAIALSHNPKNRVISFDVEKYPDIAKISIANLQFKIENVLNDKNLIISSPFIMLDTYHDGTFEHKFHDTLLSIKYKGIVMYDDIYLNEPMKKFWNSITSEKYDITHIGHWSGTGIVQY